MAGVIHLVKKDENKKFITCNHCGHKGKEYIAHVYFKQIPAEIYAAIIKNIDTLSKPLPTVRIADKDISRISDCGDVGRVIVDEVHAVALCFNCCRKFDVPIYSSYAELMEKGLDKYYKYSEILEQDIMNPDIWL